MVSEVITKIKLKEEKIDISKIPVIIHDIEWSWFTKEATLIANPNGEAQEFIDYFNENLI